MTMKTSVLPEITNTLIDVAFEHFSSLVKSMQISNRYKDSPLAIFILFPDPEWNEGFIDLNEFNLDCVARYFILGNSYGADPTKKAQKTYLPNALRKARAALRTGQDGLEVFEDPQPDDFGYYGAARTTLINGQIIITAVSGLREREDLCAARIFNSLVEMELQTHFKPDNRPQTNENDLVI